MKWSKDKMRAYDDARLESHREYKHNYHMENRVVILKRMKNTAAMRTAAARAFVRYLKARPCLDCGIEYPAPAMQFDHVEGEKNFNIGAGAQRGLPQLIIEISKCEVVCANCHAIRTWGEVV